MKNKTPLLDQLREQADRYRIGVDYDGREIVLVCPDNYVFSKGTPTEIYRPWDNTPIVAMLRLALKEINELGAGMQHEESL